MTKGIFINDDFSGDAMEKHKDLLQRAKELREEGKFAKLVYDRLIVCDSCSRLENAEDRDSSGWDISVKDTMKKDTMKKRKGLF